MQYAAKTRVIDKPSKLTTTHKGLERETLVTFPDWRSGPTAALGTPRLNSGSTPQSMIQMYIQKYKHQAILRKEKKEK